MGRPEFNNYTFYKFSCKTEDIDCCYVGSTANFLARQRNHKSMCNNANSKDYNKKLYETIRANGGWENWTMTIIGEAENISLKDARIKEEEYRVNLKAELNMVRAYCSNEIGKNRDRINAKLYKENHKEVIAEITKRYYENNKEEILAKCKKYYENNKEERIEYNKQYALINNEKLTEYRKQYRLKNAEKIKEEKRLSYLKKKEMKSLEK